MTTTDTTRVSLRDIREAAFRALSAHGASHGEARTASRMVLQAELTHGGGLAALLDDLRREPWSRTPVEVAPVPGDGAVGPGILVLGSAAVNRLLREAPLAIELVAGDRDARAVGVPCAVADGSALLDSLSIEIARGSGADVAVIICAPVQSSPTPTSDGAGRNAGRASGQLRLARPDGSVGIGALGHLPPVFEQAMGCPGVMALRDIEHLGDVDLSWISADDRAHARAQAAANGVTVDTGIWGDVYAACRRYLVPD